MTSANTTSEGASLHSKVDVLIIGAGPAGVMVSTDFEPRDRQLTPRSRSNRRQLIVWQGSHVGDFRYESLTNGVELLTMVSGGS